MPTLLSGTDERRRTPHGVRFLPIADALRVPRRKFDRPLVVLADSGRLMRDIGVGVLCGVGIGALVAMISDRC